MWFKRLFTLFFTFLSWQIALSQQTEKSNWYVPDYAKLQFAGAIGFLSAGAGYIHAGEKMETELMLGYLPENIGGEALTSLTLKTNYMPWKSSIKPEKWDLIPLQAGAYLSYTFGEQFWTFLPDRYKPGQYWWPTSLRYGMFVGSRLRMHMPAGKKVSALDFYYEIGTYELKFVSYFQNVGSISLLDIVNISAGVKIAF